jgi:hypothetical protein
MDKQAIFDRVATHLLKQNRRAIKRFVSDDGTDVNEKCMYRGEDGLSCAIGCLIPDSKYEERFENLTPDTDPEVHSRNPTRYESVLAFRAMLAEVTGAEDENDFSFLRGLQRVHDFGDPANWAARLSDFAKDNGLRYSVVV